MWLRTALRFAASVAAVSGVLLVVDAAVTLAWQEPFSALLAARGQERLAEQLDRRAAAPAGAPAGRGGTRRAARRLSADMQRGDAIGRLRLPSLDRSYVVAHGTDAETLRSAPGHYPGTALPGQGTTVAVAGHRTTYGAPFRTIDDLRRGDPVIVEMPYGRFAYRVVRTIVVRPDETSVVAPADSERLVLTACHPLYSASQRIVVFAEPAARPPSTSGASRRSRSTSRPATTASETATTSSQ